VTGSFNVNGMRNQSNNFLLDGASNNDTFNTGFVLRPPPDAIQEFKILTHSYSAEYGRNAGSVVNVVTKSGTNRWHGAAWEFNRDDALQARNFFAPTTQPKPKLKQNQFGASLGGPLATNKLFAFAYYEGYRNVSGTTTTLAVLSPEQRRGDFSGCRPCATRSPDSPSPGTSSLRRGWIRSRSSSSTISCPCRTSPATGTPPLRTSRTTATRPASASTTARATSTRSWAATSGATATA
jgi:hypothetical protein